jgi:hypothetical protein
MARRQYPDRPLTGKDANHAMAPARNTLKKAVEEVLRFLHLAEKKVLLPEIQNVSHAMKI